MYSRPSPAPRQLHDTSFSSSRRSSTHICIVVKNWYKPIYCIRLLIALPRLVELLKIAAQVSKALDEEGEQ
jgi:hypothetical protein